MFPTPDSSFAAIAADNTWAHRYPDAARMLKEKDIGVKFSGGMEFFDLLGRRLAPVFSPAWELVDLQPTMDEPDPGTVRRRLLAVVEHVKAFIIAHPEVAERFGLTCEEAIDALPQLQGETIAAYLASFPGAELPNTGNWFHNALHAGGWTH